MKKFLLPIACFFYANSFAQISVTTSNDATAVTYSTLKEAFDAVNAGTHTGIISMSVVGNTTETASATLNASTTYTSITLKPATGVTASISGTIASGALLKINGSNFTIDGSNTENGTSRNLTFENTATASSSFIALVGSANSAAPLTNATFKNATFINGNRVSNSGIILASGASAAVGYFTNITFKNNSIQKSLIGINANAALVSGNGAVLIEGNDFSTSGDNALYNRAVSITGVDGAIIKNNTIGNFADANSSKAGIYLGAGTINSTVIGNHIFNINSTVATANTYYTIYGIQQDGGVARNASTNNVITENIIESLNSKNVGTIAGITISGGSSTFPTNAVTVSKNKIFGIKNTYITASTATSNSSGAAVGIYVSSASNNTTTGINIYNNFINDVSVNSSNSIMATNFVPYNASGIAIANGKGYKIYNNTVNNLHADGLGYGVTNGTSATTGLLIMALVASDVDIRNNIFSNTNTGSLGETYAIYSFAANTVFSNIDYNDYYTTGSNLAYIGSARASFSDLKDGFGGNANSLNIQPVFSSSTDLHLSAANMSLDNKGVVLAEIADDIDGDIRNSSTPDMGADEFSSQTLSTNVISAKEQLRIYPNPFSDIIKISNAKGLKSITIVDLSGRIIKTINNLTQEINLNDLSKGSYVLKLNFENGTSKTLKAIKK